MLASARHPLEVNEPESSVKTTAAPELSHNTAMPAAQKGRAQPQRAGIVNPTWQMMALAPRARPAVIPPSYVARKCAQCEEEEEQRGESTIARKAAAGDTPSTVTGIRGALGPGSPLPAATRGFFGPRFGADFSNVRVHTDAAGHAAARRFGALAFTVGNDIAFAPGQYDPHGASGQRLLAHELTHVVQQSGTPAPQQVRRAASTTPSDTASRSEGASESGGDAAALLGEAVGRFARFQANARARLADVGGTAVAGKASHLQGIAADQIDRLGPLISRVRGIAGNADAELQQKLAGQLSSGTLGRAEAWLQAVGGSPSPAAPAQPISVRNRTAPGVALKSLDVSRPGDPAEIEADRVADAIMSGTASTRTIHSSPESVHRFSLPELVNPETAHYALMAWELAMLALELESLIPMALILAGAAMESAMAAVELALAAIVFEIFALPEEIIVLIILAVILLMLLIIVLVLALIYYLVFAEPGAPDEPGDKPCERPIEDPLTADTAWAIHALQPSLDQTTYGSSTLTLLNGASATVGMDMTTGYLTKYKTGGQPPSSGQDALYGFTKLPTKGAHGGSGYKQNQVYVRGHLLNQNLGGVGQALNLYPITGQANADHLNDVETDVKKRVIDDGLVVTYRVLASLVDGPRWVDVTGDGTCTYQYLDADFACTYSTYKLCDGNRVVPNPPMPPVLVKSRFDEAGFKDNVGPHCWEKY